MRPFWFTLDGSVDRNDSVGILEYVMSGPDWRGSVGILEYVKSSTYFAVQ